MTIEIEKGVPITGKSRQRFPFKDMEVGDSFFIKDGKNKSAYSSAAGFARRHPAFAFTVRKINGGIRVWRIER
jgi:hypothetical protein